MSGRARQASNQLTVALLTAATRGLRPHCSDVGLSELWISEHPDDRAEAVKLCRGCPVLEPCNQAAEANNERFGVWAGTDRTHRPTKAAA